MKIKEIILKEAISLSKYSFKIDEIIRKAIDDTIHDSAFVVRDALNSDSFEVAYVEQLLNRYIPMRVKERLTNGLLTIGKEISPLLWSVRFKPLSSKIGGQAGYEYIQLSDALITSISSKLIVQLMGELHNTERSVAEFFNVLYHYDTARYVDNEVKYLRDIFLHELVHITQHAAQPTPGPDNNWKNTEYRSYLTKNKEKFHKAIQNLESEEDMISYLSSPQEIPAHAHNMALNLIDITGGVLSGMDIDDLKHLLYNVTDIIQDFRNWVNDPRHQSYRRFNQPGTKYYKIYKRFLKQVYQELTSYKQYVESLVAQQQ